MEIDDGHIENSAKSLYHRRQKLQLGPQPETGPRNGTFGAPVRDKLLQFSSAKIDHRLQDCTAMSIYGNSWPTSFSATLLCLKHTRLPSLVRRPYCHYVIYSS